jgi:hypothetical protein
MPLAGFGFQGLYDRTSPRQQPSDQLVWSMPNPDMILHVFVVLSTVWTGRSSALRFRPLSASRARTDARQGAPQLLLNAAMHSVVASRDGKRRVPA